MPDPVPFADSPNRLVAVTVARREQLSPAFVRLGLTGPGLAAFAPAGRDLRVKILLPGPDGHPVCLADGLTEAAWRAAWRALPPAERPVMRSYTAPRVDPAAQWLDLDVYLHEPAGPASAWAAGAALGDPLLVSGPAQRAGDPDHGVQWHPGAATRVVIGADETAFPAVAGILATLGPDTRATLLLEAADPADTAPFVDAADPRLEVHHVARDGRPGGVPLLEAGRAWARRYGAGAAAAGAAFYGWFATESARVAELRRSLLEVGLGAERVHTQGYWIDRAGRARD